MKLSPKNKKVIYLSGIVIVVLGLLIFLSVKYILPTKPPEYFLKVNLTPEKRQELEDRRSKNFEMLKLFSKNYEVYLDLGNIERELGNASKAIEYFTKAWEIIPANSTPWLNIGNVYIMLGFYNKAEEAFLKAIEVNRSYWFTYYNLAQLYQDYLKDKSDQIRAIYLEGLKNTNNDYQLLYHFSEYLKATKNYSEALQYLNVLKDVIPAGEQQSVLQRIEEIKGLMDQPSAN
jgi:tetratricopeptide (TPR) repeat protein